VQEREYDADGMTQERPLLQIRKGFPRHRDILSFFENIILKTYSRYPKDVGVAKFALTNPGSPSACLCVTVLVRYRAGQGEQRS